MTHVFNTCYNIYSEVRELKYSELKKQLQSIGCYKYQEGKRHEHWYSPVTGNRFPVGRHDAQEVAIGTLKSIKKDAGLK